VHVFANAPLRYLRIFDKYLAYGVIRKGRANWKFY